MFKNRIKQASKEVEARKAMDRRVPQAAAFVFLPGACMTPGAAPWIYQLAYEQAQAAAAEPHFELPAFSPN